MKNVHTVEGWVVRSAGVSRQWSRGKARCRTQIVRGSVSVGRAWQRPRRWARPDSWQDGTGGRGPLECDGWAAASYNGGDATSNGTVAVAVAMPEESTLHEEVSSEIVDPSFRLWRHRLMPHQQTNQINKYKCYYCLNKLSKYRQSGSSPNYYKVKVVQNCFFFCGLITQNILNKFQWNFAQKFLIYMRLS